MKPLLLVMATTLSYAQERPVTRKIDHVDRYHGTEVKDPYRWLEDDRSAETAAWVAEENRYTESYFAKTPYRGKVEERLRQLMNFPKVDTVIRRGDTFYLLKNDGLQNQSVWYVQKGAQGKPEVLIDPNKLSTDGTVALSQFTISRNGKYAAYLISRGGSDWREAKVMDLATRKLLPETLEWLKFSSIAWFGDGFFYSSYPKPEAGKELSGQMQFHRVFYHKVGTPQSADELVYEDKAHPLRYHNLDTDSDERYAALTIFDAPSGKKGNALLVTSLVGPRKFVPVAAEASDDTFAYVDHVGGKLIIQTSKGAPLGQLLLFDPVAAKFDAKPLVAEQKEALEASWTAGGKLFTAYTRDVISVFKRWTPAGKLEGEIAMPSPGTAMVVSGEPGARDFYFAHTSLSSPATIYRYAVDTNRVEPFFTPQIPSYRAGDYETRQVFYQSKDGTKIPMFLFYKKGLVLNGKNPTLLYGYGGFAVNISPTFNPQRLALIEKGFVYAQANLRGGLEYGETWHEAGTKLKKQNVFDDFIAAAEWLIANKYTSSDKLAIHGASNGGLLVGAVINQRPELFRAAIPAVGVMDMLRFHKFTAGAGWIGDYGSSDNPEEFRYLLGYSPVHNIKQGQKYPAVMVTTADHDDRVVPAHSFKYAATMQEKASTERPVIIRIETKSGHGASSLGKAIELNRDMFTFLFHELGVNY